MYTTLNAGAIGIKTDLAGVLALAKAHGFRAVEFSIVEATELAARKGIDAVRQMFAEAGVRPGNFSFPVEYRKDEATWRAGLEALRQQAQTARALGVNRTATWITPANDERDFATNFRWHVERLRPAAQILAEHGIAFGLEFVGTPSSRVSRRYNFLHSMDGVLALCAAIGTDNLGLLLDSWHWYVSHGNLDDLAKLSAREVVVVHVNDAPPLPIPQLQDGVRELPCATGVIDLKGFMQALAKMGYDGPIIVEPFNQRVREMSPDEATRATAESLRTLWGVAGLAA